jgi:uncharacterized protein YggE
MERSVVRGISVWGQGSVDARPDTVYVDLGFTARHASVSEAQRESARNMAAVIETLKARGLPPEDIQSSDLNVWRDEESGVFVASHGVRLRIRDVASTGQLLDAAVTAGANNVRGIAFAVEDRGGFEREARERAMHDAARKAAELATLGGVRLGAPISISEEAVHYQPLMVRGPMEAMAAAAPALMATPVEPGQAKVSVSVHVTYATV